MTLGIWAPDPYLGDALFDPTSPLNRDDCLAAFPLLRAAVEARGGRCHTVDVLRANGMTPDVVLFLDVPSELVDDVLRGWPGARAWAVLQESEVILPRNWDAARLARFETVFTWRDPIVDGERFVKLNFPNVLHVPEPLDIEQAERRLCALIAGNKRSAHPLELYSRRVEAIRWFEEHHIEDFSLYGVGWRDVAVGAYPGAEREAFPSYRGSVERKREVLDGHWFTICFENARDIPGYITEKLFDCLLARTVPIYRGADNITDHVPAGCFIDARDVGSYAELYELMTTIEPDAYVAHLEAARSFLGSEAARPFSVQGYVQTIDERLAA
jgi:hypothetical protein